MPVGNGDPRTRLVRRIARAVDALGARGRAVVAFDGPDAAGKTTLADDVAAAAAAPVCRASIDGFHAPALMRARRGSMSAEGYYRDSFDHHALEDRLLVPFLGGEPRVDTQVFDHRADAGRRTSLAVGPTCVLLFDGVFLLRPELRRFWTLSIYLHVTEQRTLDRARQRDADLFGSEEATLDRYRRRYLPGQALYRDEAHPIDVAHVVVDNDDLSAPRVLRWIAPG